MTALAKTQTEVIARPLKVLVPLIKQDIDSAKEAERKAGMPYYQAAGEKLIEAKSQLAHGEFRGWVQRNFGIKDTTATIYMQLARATESQNVSAQTFSSLSDFVRQTSNPNYNKPHTVRPQPWHEPVKEIVNKVDADYLERQREKKLNEANEYKLERDLALKIIDIGYKTLATKLHPDKGGSDEAMHRLQRVVNKLKGAI